MIPVERPRLGWVPALFLLALPFGEGGAAPGALFAIHTLVFAGAAALALLPAGSRPPALMPRSLLAPASAFVIALLLSAWGTPYPYASFLRCLDLLVAGVAFVLARRWGAPDPEHRMLRNCLLASGVLQAGAVLFGAAAGRLPATLAAWGLLNANHQAAYLGFASLIALPELLAGDRKRSSWRLAAMALCLAAFSVLASRGALLGLAAGVLWLAWDSRGEISGKRRLAVAAIFAGVAGLSVLALAHRFAALGDPFPYERARIWKADLNCFAGHPVLGVGPGVFRHVAHRFNFPLAGPVRYARNFETPHSDYLGFLVETGIVGFASALFLGARILAVIGRSRRASPLMGTGLMAGAIALAVQAAVEDLSLRPALILSLAVLAGVASRETEVTESRLFRGWKEKALFAALPVAVAWAIAVLCPYAAFRNDQAMRHAASLKEMENHFQTAVAANRYQGETWRFPATAFLAARPPAGLTLELYARFRLELDQGIRVDSASADLLLTRARLESRAFRELFHDEATLRRALESYREGVRRVPHDPRPRLEMATFLNEIGRGQEALVEVRKALREEPGFLAARLLAALLLQASGDLGAAKGEWERARDIRHGLLTYRPDSVYAADIVRDVPPYEARLRELLGPS
ncbi:MAG TPA: O-antigen ligase family protein [Candidatus Polarisedimenticolia bacterium]|jgi:O-antigen ligase|nr:O-antigen ligase family protein [Candidatus Polarisedimenticolia bacterium]